VTYQAVIIGGGFFGCAIALHLRRRGFERIYVIERELQLLTRASYRNQARVHNGYHYPRSCLTAYRSHMNLPTFRRDYGFAVKTDFVMLYAISARRSKVTPRQFELFMRDVGVRYEAAGSEYFSLFDAARIAAVYVVDEYAFDARRLRDYFYREFAAANIDLALATESLNVQPHGLDDRLEIGVRSGNSSWTIEADMVFNCTYANLNRTVRDGCNNTALKHELAELALVDVPPQLVGLGITVMDGPFFSCMPFPPERCHSLSHVRYTPHDSLIDCDGGRDPARNADQRLQQPRAHFMIADAARLVPSLKSARWQRSLFEAKTVLARNEVDDGRPILLRRERMHPRLFSVLGAKIDNIYDVLARIDSVLREQHEVRSPDDSGVAVEADYEGYRTPKSQ
jgi:glycine/D-amino acid oxidase-like deaminating enzyme